VNGQRWVELGALALLVAVALAVLWPFLVPIGWAAILVIATWPLFCRIERGLGGRTGWASAAMTLLMIVLVVGPALLVSVALAAEIRQAFRDLKAWAAAPGVAIPGGLGDLPVIGPALTAWIEHVLADPALLRDWLLARLSRGNIAVAAGNVGRSLAGAAFALLTLFFLYRRGAEILGQVRRAARRLAGERVHSMLHPLGETVRAVMYGMLFTALAQGSLAMLGYWVAGTGSPVLLGAATMLLALLPFGAPIVYVPTSLWLVAQGRPLAGLLLLAWGIVVVSTVDNLIRSWIISGATRVPFLLVFFGVIGGLAAFGSLGLFIGPVSIALLLELWREWTDADAGIA
jgi:predicted PurR-regulated permease PerM